MSRLLKSVAAIVLLLSFMPGVASAQPKKKEVWTDAADPTLPADFKIQGEYAEGRVGVQVIALGNGEFHAVVYVGGLPGTARAVPIKSLMAGKLDGDKAVFAPAEGNRKYLAQKPEEFSATSKYPPDGQKTFPHSAVIEKGVMKLKSGEDTMELKRIVRESPTMGAKAPEGAIILFDGSNKNEWKGGRVDEKTKFLNTDGGDMVTAKKFNNYTIHVEFMLPYRPDARGQGRGNSGFYQVDIYEVQILDSFGLDGKNNETGGVYSQYDPKLNMCLPPLQWQTYDVDFTNAELGADGKKTKNSRVTVKLNGVVVQDDLELAKGKTGGARQEPEGTPGPIRLQGHGNPLQFRNIWIVEKR